MNDQMTTLAKRPLTRGWRAGVGATLTFVAAMVVGPANAAYPEAPIRVIIPFAPAAGTDLVFRMIAPTLERELGQRLVIENKTGAGGDIGNEFVAKAPADGYTLIVNSTNLILNPLLQQSPKYSLERNFIAVASLATTQIVMVANANTSPFKNLSEFIAYSKKYPTKLNYGAMGAGSPPDLMAELLRLRASAEFVPIMYRGVGPMLIDLLAGNVDFSFSSAKAVKQHIDAGKLRAIAVTGKQRLVMLPDVPTFTELGIDLAPMAKGTWWGLFAPAGTPDGVVRTLSDAALRALKDPDVQRQLTEGGYAAAPGSSQQFADELQQETMRWKQIAPRLGAK